MVVALSFSVIGQESGGMDELLGGGCAFSLELMSFLSWALGVQIGTWTNRPWDTTQTDTARRWGIGAASST